jgi:O-antigen ligase
VPNVALHVLFDTGIVGFAFLGIAVLVVARGAVRALLKPAQTWDSGDCALLGLLVAFGALFLCYQMTDGTWMGFTWFTFALLVISTRFARSAPVRA